MEVEKKRVGLTLGLLGAGALLCLTGGIIGKSLVGWLLFAVGLALIVVIGILNFAVIRGWFAAKRGWSLAGASLLAVLVLAGLVLLLASRNSAAARPNGGNPPPQMQGTPGVGLPQPGGASATVIGTVVAATEVPTMAAATSEPGTAIFDTAATPTATAVSSMFVCLNEKTRVGYDIRLAPSKTAGFGGFLDWGSCFYIDGKAEGYSGWYHVQKGQNGSVGVTIDVNEDKHQLWVDGYYLESFGNDLNTLPDITVVNN